MIAHLLEPQTAPFAVALGVTTAAAAIENQWMEGVSSASDDPYAAGGPSLSQGEAARNVEAEHQVYRSRPGGPTDPIAAENADQPWAGPDEIFGPSDEIPPPSMDGPDIKF